MTFDDLMKQAGTVQVNLAPLLVIIGAAATAAESDLPVGDMLEKLTVDPEPEKVSQAHHHHTRAYL